MIDHQEILDLIRSIRARIEAPPEELRLHHVEREEALGMRFRKGVRVIDRRTGQRGEIIAGYIRAAPKT